MAPSDPADLQSPPEDTPLVPPADTPLVEVRVPTYNRPDLLERALRSLLAQSHRIWRAVILDDGDAARTRRLLDGIGDPRLLHRPNEVRLGAGPNISRAFSMAPLAGGTFFHVLEDDNALAPGFLAENLRLMAAHGVSVVVNNQWVEKIDARDPAALAHDVWVTIDCFTDGVWTADDFKIALLWRLPLSNGALFWKLGCRSDLAVADVADPGLQEWLRCYRLADALYFNGTPNAFWRPDSTGYAPDIPAFLTEQRVQQAIRRRVLAALQARGEMAKILSDRFRTPLAQREEGVRRSYGRWPAPSELRLARRVDLAAKALAVRWLARAPSPAVTTALARETV